MKFIAPFVWLGLLLLCLVPNLLPILIGGLLGVAPPDIGATPLAVLLLLHLALVLAAEAIVLLLGLPVAIWATRPERNAWRQLLESLASLGQTVPTLAILALAVPVLGLGFAPTLFGMVLYGLMPVVSNGIAGFLGLDKNMLEAATGMGMTARQRLYKIELPLALPVLMAGIRTSTVFNVATAVVGATLGVGGLGLPIINGLSQQNTALVLVGAVLSALLALTLDAFLGLVSR